MITEKELIRAAKTFRANCIADGDKMTLADACKIVLLTELFSRDHTLEQTIAYYRMVNDPRPWWKFW